MFYHVHSLMDILKKAAEGEMAGIKVNGTPNNNTRQADEIMILAGDIEDIQRRTDIVVSCSEEYSLKPIILKKKFMRISKTYRNNENLILNGRNIEQLKKYTYLGTMIHCNDYTNEIKI